jgi:hypothetical protein
VQRECKLLSEDETLLDPGNSSSLSHASYSCPPPDRIRHPFRALVSSRLFPGFWCLIIRFFYFFSSSLNHSCSACAGDTGAVGATTLTMAVTDDVNGGPPLSLRPVPIADKKPKNISDFIARVNAQPGGFRSLNADQLRADIQARRDRGEAEDDADLDSSDEEEGEDDGPKDLNLIRMEVLKNIEYASPPLFARPNH